MHRLPDNTWFFPSITHPGITDIKLLYRQRFPQHVLNAPSTAATTVPTAAPSIPPTAAPSIPPTAAPSSVSPATTVFPPFDAFPSSSSSPCSPETTVAAASPLFTVSRMCCTSPPPFSGDCGFYDDGVFPHTPTSNKEINFAVASPSTVDLTLVDDGIEVDEEQFEESIKTMLCDSSDDGKDETPTADMVVVAVTSSELPPTASSSDPCSSSLLSNATFPHDESVNGKTENDHSLTFPYHLFRRDNKGNIHDCCNENSDHMNCDCDVAIVVNDGDEKNPQLQQQIAGNGCCKVNLILSPLLLPDSVINITNPALHNVPSNTNITNKSQKEGSAGDDYDEAIQCCYQNLQQQLPSSSSSSSSPTTNCPGGGSDSNNGCCNTSTHPARPTAASSSASSSKKMKHHWDDTTTVLTSPLRVATVTAQFTINAKVNLMAVPCVESDIAAARKLAKGKSTKATSKFKNQAAVRVTTPYRDMFPCVFSNGAVKLAGLKSQQECEQVADIVVEKLKGFPGALTSIGKGTAIKRSAVEVVMRKADSELPFRVRLDAAYEELVTCLRDTEYRPDCYCAVKTRVPVAGAPGKMPCVMLFHSGKLCVAGRCSEEELNEAVNMVAQILHRARVKVEAINCPASPHTRTAECGDRYGPSRPKQKIKRKQTPSSSSTAAKRKR